MSLFGNKPLFGSTTAASTSSGISFVSSTTTTSGPSLFGTSTTTSSSKPLFGSVPQSGTTSSLFGTGVTTSGSLFGAKTTTTTSAGNLFGSTTTGGLFSKPTSGFGSSGGTGLFGSKPVTGGLFGSVGSTQPAVETKQTFQGILQDSDALVRSLTKVELFGDERDEMIAKLNQLAAAAGVGCGYYKDGQQPVQYHQDGPFHRIKAIGYNRTSEYTDSDGIVALIIKAPFSECHTSEQKQRVVDALFVILGSKPSIHAHIESVRALPDNCTELCIYVTEKFRGRIPSRELSQYLNQGPQKQQLETQLKVDKERIISRVQMEKQQKALYLKDPPTGFDTSLWAQAVRENPDPERLVPYPIRGFEQLRTRQKIQIENVRAENAVVDAMKTRISRIEANVSAFAVEFARRKVLQKQLSHRLLRILSMQLMSQRYTQGFDVREESMHSALESINARLNAPHQIKSRITEAFETLRVNDSTLRSSVSEDSCFISEADALNLKKYLDRCQDGLESLVSVLNSNLEEIQLLATSKGRRIVFVDSDDDEGKHASTSKLTTTQVKLFEDSSGGSDEDSLINFTSRHEGKKGEKLMKMEASFNFDSRFKLDDRFASSGNDDSDDEMLLERAKNLEVLSKVLGSSIKRNKKENKYFHKSANGHETIRPFTRFNPSNKDHVSWLKHIENSADIERNEELSAQETFLNNKCNEKANEIFSEIQPELVKEVRIPIILSLNHTFSFKLKTYSENSCDAANDAPFSFFAMVGRPTTEEYVNSKNNSDSSFPVKNPGEITKTDVDIGNGVLPETSATCHEQTINIVKTKFFVTGEEPHLRSLVNNFRRTQSLEKVISRWGNHRDIFSKNYKHLRKISLRETKRNLLHGDNLTPNVKKKCTSQEKQKSLEE
ncbi:hypothetical protein DICVIV_07983 [Dictyocaulus viviparus]|uniref:Nucleoporin Nup54 alpha-helical domain-containing protein n=1 Tax=Dictyocaulus viviparus TaxID=29172 RepID=A0A0D8XN55_DICVI|nr:hypothetical protein DICVIV_07983 [Dictyocaulus viviparus]